MTPPLSILDISREFISKAEGDELRWLVALCKHSSATNRAKPAGADRWGLRSETDLVYKFVYWDEQRMNKFMGRDYLAWEYAGPMLGEMPFAQLVFDTVSRGDGSPLANEWGCRPNYIDPSIEPFDASPTVAICRAYCLWVILTPKAFVE